MNVEKTEHPLLEVKRIGTETFFCVRKQDAADADIHVVSQHGVNYGAWQSVENFVKAYKKAQAGETEGLIATPLGSARVSIRSW